jgi:3-oxoacyl-[acyl-carrier-protein] synthase III
MRYWGSAAMVPHLSNLLDAALAMNRNPTHSGDACCATFAAAAALARGMLQGHIYAAIEASADPDTAREVLADRGVVA